MKHPSTLNRRLIGTAVILSFAGVLLVALGLARAQQIRHEGFEGREPLWIKGPADAAYREVAHRTTEDLFHTGQRSETIQLQAEAGTFIHYLYDVGKAPLSDELAASVWVRANRPGIQLLGRLVLPHEHNPGKLDEPLTTLLPGDMYDKVSRWQPLSLRRPTKLAKERQALLRAELKRDVNFEDAYIDRLVLNVYGGPGQTEVWIDDLDIGPVTETPTATAPNGGAAGNPGMLTNRPVPRRPTVIDLDRDQLLVSGKRIFFRAIRHTDTPLKVLRDAGFNTIWLDEGSSPAEVEQAVNLGFYLVPSLPLAEGQDALPSDTHLAAMSGIGRKMSRFLDQDAVLFWDLGGGGLSLEQAGSLARTAQLVRATDPQRPLAADVWDGFQPYSRTVNLLGVHRWPLMTALELPQYREWLNQRRLLAQPSSAFLWTWVQTHLPEWHTAVAYERAGKNGKFDEPIGPLPEQIRLLAYTAIGSGCRGLGFWSDRFLADSHQGRDRLLALASINQELQMLEPLLVAADQPTWIGTGSADVQAAVFRTEKAVLVLPIWVGRGSQYVPGQAAASNLTITVPQVPDAMQAWEVSPGEVHSLPSKRVVGGRQVTIPEFGLTTALVFTSDNGQTGLLVRLQDQARAMRKLAAQWAYQLGEVELDKVTRINAELEQTEHRVPDAESRLADARKRLERCVRVWNDGDYAEAYHEAQRALRPLGILMREQWEKAAGDLDIPVASPYAVSYFTLPKHWQFADRLKQSVPGINALPNGDFELAPDRSPEAWVPQEITMDDVELAARRVAESPHEGQQCLLLEIKAKDKQKPPAALERTFLAIHSPAVRMQPGSLVRISGWVRVPEKISASADGALLYDSAGGEPLAVRLLGELKKWRQFTWYRTVPASGTINVTLALTGIGKVYFDDVKIEPMLPGQGQLTASAEQSLRSPKVPEAKNDENKERTTPATPPRR